MRSMSDDHTHVQEFFGARAADWDSRFPDDGPAYAAAVGRLGLRAGARVLDAGCGAARAGSIRGTVPATGWRIVISRGKNGFLSQVLARA